MVLPGPNPRVGPGWGTFTGMMGVVHVAPVDANSQLAGDHELHAYCWCSPKVEFDGVDALVIIHRHPDWPGADPTIGARYS